LRQQDFFCRQASPATAAFTPRLAQDETDARRGIRDRRRAAPTESSRAGFVDATQVAEREQQLILLQQIGRCADTVGDAPLVGIAWKRAIGPATSPCRRAGSTNVANISTRTARPAI
jgi:hypothetical protein